MKQKTVCAIGFPAIACSLAMLATQGCSDAKAATEEPEKKQAPAAVVGADVVKEISQTTERRYRGRILSPETVVVVPQVSGTIEEVAFTEGQTVKKGQLLYRIDDVKYVAAVESAKASIAQCEATLVYAKKTADRTQTLFERKVASADDLDAAISSRDAAAAALAAAKASLITAEDNLKHTRIVSPVDGKLGLNSFSVGNYVTPSSGGLATIVCQDPLRLVFPVSSGDFLRYYGSEAGLREKFAIQITLADGTVYAQPGKIEFVDNRANATTDSINVYAKFENPEGLLIPGGTVTVSVTEKNLKNEVAVPLSAVVHDQSGAYVWVLDASNIPVRRDIAEGDMLESVSIVKEGLVKGERIVTLGTHKVFPGVAVQVAGAN
ncbi:MAG: efflux RND transporter periplasmic adaptor subunit [Kiritimatiellia bacterium]